MNLALAREILACESNDVKVIVGVSGGPDSMALLHLLRDLSDAVDTRIALHIAHLNHRLRGDDSEKDAGFVQAVADDLGMPSTIESCDVGALTGEGSGGVEEVGRRERYAFFERVALRVGARFVAVGHHADDNTETILHRILRGTGLRGLRGIQPSRPLNAASQIRLIRPLLETTRKEILAYLADRGIAFRDDESNESTEAMRNRIRNSLLPLIESEVNPQVRDALRRLGEQARWVDEYLAETVHRTFDTLIVSHTDQQLALNVDALARKSRIVQTEIVRIAYRSFGLGEQDLSFAHMVSVLDLIGEPASGRQVQLPGGMTIEKRYHRLLFSLPSDEPREDIASEIAVHVPGVTMLPIRRLEIECRIEKVTPAQIHQLRRQTCSMEEYITLSAVHPPLIVRTRRPGDRFYPLGAPGSKKIAEFLVDAKVDPVQRERIALLCDQLGPVWLIGHRIDDRVKLTTLTREVLHITARAL